MRIRGIGFNPTLVRLAQPWELGPPGEGARFNPTLVRLALLFSKFFD